MRAAGRKAGGCIAFFAVFFTVMMLTHPRESTAITLKGLAHLKSVIPAVFPYLVLSGLLLKSGLDAKIAIYTGGFFEKVFKLPRAAFPVLIAGVLCGFPVGARCSAELFASGGCTERDADRLSAMCNFCSPPFLITVVGAKLMNSASAGWLLFGLQTFFALAFGFFYRRPAGSVRANACARKRARDAFREEDVSFGIIPAAIGDAALQTLRICGIVLFFSVLSGVAALPFAERLRARPELLGLLYGFFEFSSGCLSLTPGADAACYAALITGFSGLSVLAQCATFLVPSGVSMKGWLLAHLLCPLLTSFSLFLFKTTGIL